MDLSTSYNQIIPENIRDRYGFIETRHAASLLAATNPNAWQQVLTTLAWFQLKGDDLVAAGGQESKLAARLNDHMRANGWRETTASTEVEVFITKKAYKPAGEKRATTTSTKASSATYLIDNVVDRVALDVEWNAKDGNLDRDLAAYRSLYEGGVIDGAIMITREFDSIRELAYRLSLEAGLPEDAARKRLNTSTTTNDNKLRPRMERGDAGGCPFLAVLISNKTWDGRPATPVEGYVEDGDELEAEKDPLLDEDGTDEVDNGSLPLFNTDQ